MKPAFLQTNRKESFETWKFRTFMNLYPMYFGTGGKILFWSGDSQEVHLRLSRSLWTYNYVGTIFGGSMFAAADPFYMLMLLRILGKDFVVWDKAGSIRFRKPARKTLYIRYELNETVLERIRNEVTINGQTEYTFQLQWIDAEGTVYAEMERLCYIADKAFYHQKKGEHQRSRFKAE